MDADVFSREPNGLIALRITQDEFLQLLMVLGYAMRAASGEKDEPMFAMSIRVANRLNAGNPEFIPYEIPEDIPQNRIRPRRSIEDLLAHMQSGQCHSGAESTAHCIKVLEWVLGRGDFPIPLSIAAEAQP